MMVHTYTGAGVLDFSFLVIVWVCFPGTSLLGEKKGRTGIGRSGD